MEEQQIILSPREVYRITVVGDHRSGKTTFIKKNLLMDQYRNAGSNHKKMYVPGQEANDEDYIQPTLNVDFFYKNKIVNDSAYKIIIVDTPGHPAFRLMTEIYYTNYDALIIVFDLASEREFSNIPNWLQKARELNLGYNDYNKTIFLLGIFKGKQTVPDKDIESLATRHQLVYLKYCLYDEDVLEEIFKIGIKNRVNGRISKMRPVCLQDNYRKQCDCNIM